MAYEFIVGTDVKSDAEFVDDAGAYYDPDAAPTIYYYAIDAENTLLSSSVMSKEATGKYYHYYDTTGLDDGGYRAVVIAEVGGQTVKVDETFALKGSEWVLV